MFPPLRREKLVSWTVEVSFFFQLKEAYVWMAILTRKPLSLLQLAIYVSMIHLF